MLQLTPTKGLFQYTQLPFGIAPAPSRFQRIIDSLIQDVPHVVGYLDDTLVTGKNEAEHQANLDTVLQRFEEYGIGLKKEKCAFSVPNVTCFGHGIDEKGLRPTDEKVRAVKETPAPTNVSELKAYLGLLSYYGRFLPSLSTVLAPLHSLLRHMTRSELSSQQQVAFD